MKVLNQRSDAAIATQDFFVPSDTAGIDLHLRRKRLAHVEKFPAERTLLLMHGATFSSGSLFDAPVGGASLMDQLAIAGFDVYAVDVRGYGPSTWPPDMEGAVDPSTQPVRIETAIRDLGTAIDHILQYRRLDQLNLVAMSWGGSVAGAYTAKNDGKIKRLALIAPLWLRETPGRIDQGGDLPAYREVYLWKYEGTWRAAAPKDQGDALIPPGWFSVWAEKTLAIGPRGAVPNTILAPSGAIQGSVATLQSPGDRLAGCSSWHLRFAVYSSGGNLSRRSSCWRWDGTFAFPWRTSASKSCAACVAVTPTTSRCGDGFNGMRPNCSGAYAAT